MITRRRIVVPLLAVLALLAGCSQPEAGTAIPDGTQSAEASGTETGGGDSADSPVPHISEPLDASPYLDDPCGLMPRSFVEDLGYRGSGEQSPGEVAGIRIGPGCSWETADHIKLLNYNFQTAPRERGEPGGLRQAYAVTYKKLNFYTFWEPTEVAGYPAAFTDFKDRRDQGHCHLLVGIADDLSLGVAAGGHRDEPARACENATAFATKVVEVLKGGS